MRRAGSKRQSRVDDCSSAETPVTPVQSLRANAGPIKRREFRIPRAAAETAHSGPAAGDLGAAASSEHETSGIEREGQPAPDAAGGPAKRACNGDGETPASTAPAPGVSRQLGCVGGQLQRLMKQQRVRLLQHAGQMQYVRQLQRRLGEAEKGRLAAVQEADEARRAAAEAECGRSKAVQEADQAIWEANEANQEANEVNQEANEATQAAGKARRAAAEAEYGRVMAAQEAFEARQAAAEVELGRSNALHKVDRARRSAAAAKATVKTLEVLRSVDAANAMRLEGLLSDMELEHAAVRTEVQNLGSRVEHLQSIKASLIATALSQRQHISILETAQGQAKAARSEAAAHVKTLNRTISELESELRKAPQQLAHLAVRISELEQQQQQQSAREERRRRVEAEETAKVERRRRDEAEETVGKGSQIIKAARTALELQQKRISNLELDNQAAQALVKAARSEAAAQVKVLNRTVSELETELRKAPQLVAHLTAHISELESKLRKVPQVAHFTARITDLEQQLQHSAGEAAREERRLRAEVAEAASEAKRHQAEAAALQDTLSELELKLKRQPESESISLVDFRGDVQSHFRTASTKGELEGLARKLLPLWHPDRRSLLGQGSAALATRVTQIITGLKDECMKSFK